MLRTAVKRTAVKRNCCEANASGCRSWWQTGCDLLWSGVPIITCQMQSMCSRVAGSLLHAAEMPELVTHDMDSYVRLAVRLGNDREQLLVSSDPSACM